MIKTDLRYQAKEEIFIGRAKFLRDSELWKRIMIHKWGQSSDIGYDIDLIPAIISYLIDNPSLIPAISGNLEQVKEIKCPHVSDIQRELLPIAIQRNRYYRSYEANQDVGEEYAKNDFFLNHAKKWGLKARTAICAVYCLESERCKNAHNNYKNLQELLSKDELSY